MHKLHKWLLPSILAGHVAIQQYEARVVIVFEISNLHKWQKSSNLWSVAGRRPYQPTCAPRGLHRLCSFRFVESGAFFQMDHVIFVWWAYHHWQNLMSHANVKHTFPLSHFNALLASLSLKLLMASPPLFTYDGFPLSCLAVKFWFLWNSWPFPNHFMPNSFGNLNYNFRANCYTNWIYK